MKPDTATTASVIFVLAAALARGAAPAAAECRFYRDREGEPLVYDLRLPDGQEREECRFEVDRPQWEAALDPQYAEEQGVADMPFWPLGPEVKLNVYASGQVVVETRFVGPAVSEFPGSLTTILGSEMAYFSDGFSFALRNPNPTRYEFQPAAAPVRRFVQQMGGQTREALDQRWGATEIVMTVRRLRQPCWMEARVAGDVPETRLFTGDYAFFLASDTPVKKGMMVGSLGDQELHEELDGFGATALSRDGALDLAASLGFLTEEERDAAGTTGTGAETPTEGEGNSAFSDWVRQELRPEAGEDGDNFGLSLTDVKADATPKERAAVEQMFRNSFTLTLSGQADVVNATDNAGAAIIVRPSAVTATVGLDDKDGHKISFELTQGGALAGEFQTVDESMEVVWGYVIAQLTSKGVYTLEGVTSSPRKLKIIVAAKFFARQGSFGCMQ